MEKHMYGCPNCFTSWAVKNPSLAICPECGKNLVSFDIVESTWDNISEQEKTVVKNRHFSTDTTMDSNSTMSGELRYKIDCLSADVRIVKNILIFFVAMFVISNLAIMSLIFSILNP